MSSSEEIARQLNEVASNLTTTQGQALGAIDVLEKQVEQQHNEAVASLKRDYEQQARQTTAKCKRAEALAKKKVLDITNQLICEDETESLRVAEFVQLGSIARRGDASYTVPLIIPLIGHGNICLDFRGACDMRLTEDVLRFIEGRALERTAPLQLQIISYDPLLRNLEAPYAAVQDESSSAIRYLQSAKLLDSLLDELTEQISRVKNQRLLDASTLVGYHRSVGSTIEPYMLVVMHDYPNSVTKVQHSRIKAMADTCCAAGISFLFELTSQRSTVTEKVDIEDIKETCECFSWDRKKVSWTSHTQWDVEFYGASPNDAKNTASSILEHLSGMSAPALPLQEILSTDYWQESSENGITFTLGKDGNDRVEVTLGANETQLHNMVITGAVGRGKSNLIKSFVYDVCTRYSPDEVELYLLDFKEGVTLYPMAPTPESPEYLPHVRVFGLEADQDFGIAVLEELIRIGAERARVVKPFGDNILKYRQANSDAVMPRIVLVIDEFQMFLEGARGSEAAALLVKAARTQRSYGIHIVLASQSIGSISSLLAVHDVFYAQFPIRIGLKNSPSEARATFTPLNDAAARLRYSGEAILNEDYGQPAANRKVLTAYSDDTFINSVRDKLYACDFGRHGLPSVFDGSVLAKLKKGQSNCAFAARKTVPTALFGRSLCVSQDPVAFTFEPIPGRNIAIVGNGLSPSDPDAPNMAEALIVSTARSLAQRLNGDKDEFIILDMLPRDDSMEKSESAIKSLNHICDELSAHGRPVQVFDYASSRKWIDKFLNGGQTANLEGKLYVIGLGMDRLGSMDMMMQSQFSKLVKDAPSSGTHFILWWISSTTMNAHLGMGSVGTFDGHALLFGTSTIAKQIAGPLCNWNGENARVLFKDATSGREPEKLIPFSVDEEDWFE